MPPFSYRFLVLMAPRRLNKFLFSFFFGFCLVRSPVPARGLPCDYCSFLRGPPAPLPKLILARFFVAHWWRFFLFPAASRRSKVSCPLARVLRGAEFAVRVGVRKRAYFFLLLSAGNCDRGRACFGSPGLVFRLASGRCRHP